MNKDVLVVGQGIVGSILAWELLKEKQSVCIVDDAHASSSSVMSAGLINPLTGQRLVITPQYDLLYSHALSLYQDLEQELGQKFFQSKLIVRVFRHADDLKRCEEFEFRGPGSWGKYVLDLFGSAVINNGGHCHTNLLLEAMKVYFQDQKILVQAKMNCDDLRIDDNGMHWQGMTFSKVIFCEGFKAFENPYFVNLPYNNVKGEILTLKIKEDLPDVIFSELKWLLPRGNGIYSAGANYNRQEWDMATSQEAKDEILQGVGGFLKASLECVGQQAGVRPVLIDQMPVLGFHPRFPKIGICNGFGSKAFLMAPFYVKVLVKHLLKQSAIPKEVDSQRFKLAI